MKAKLKEIDFEIIEDEIEEDEYDEDALVIKDRGLFILDLENLIIEVAQSQALENNKNIGPYKMLDHLTPYIEELFNYTLALKEEYENE